MGEGALEPPEAHSGFAHHKVHLREFGGLVNLLPNQAGRYVLDVADFFQRDAALPSDWENGMRDVSSHCG